MFKHNQMSLNIEHIIENPKHYDQIHTQLMHSARNKDHHTIEIVKSQVRKSTQQIIKDNKKFISKLFNKQDNNIEISIPKSIQSAQKNVN